ncbi:MAG: alpha/beta fold hydrolase, partial [Deltaproteobacteria bacterium]|nr:alpha/beta fold hydrolase [Deltaproteobacteria bacterium]
MKKLALIFLVLGVLFAAFASFSRLPPMPPEDSLSYQLVQPGPFDVATDAHDLVDPARFIPDPDASNGQSTRRMKVRLWYPQSEKHDPQPLLIYSHGLLGTGEAVEYIARVLASHGYVVAAPDFPRTNRSQGERAHARDVFNQPRDVAILIDWLLARSEDGEDELHNAIDAQRIAAIGHSLGGLNTHLLGFHPEWQEPRIKAVISLASPTSLFTRKFLTTRSLPYMAIAGTEDAFVEYERNFLPLLDKVDGAVLVSMEGASHLAFADEGKWFRWFDQPDAVACRFAKDTIDRNKATTEPWYDELGGIEEGYVQEINPPVCEYEVSAAMNPLRQQQLTLMAVHGF